VVIVNAVMHALMMVQGFLTGGISPWGNFDIGMLRRFHSGGNLKCDTMTAHSSFTSEVVADNLDCLFRSTLFISVISTSQRIFIHQSMYSCDFI